MVTGDGFPQHAWVGNRVQGQTPNPYGCTHPCICPSLNLFIHHPSIFPSFHHTTSIIVPYPDYNTSNTWKDGWMMDGWIPADVLHLQPPKNTLPETNSQRPLKIGRNPTGKERLPTIHFQVRTQLFRLPALRLFLHGRLQIRHFRRQGFLRGLRLASGHGTVEELVVIDFHSCHLEYLGLFIGLSIYIYIYRIIHRNIYPVLWSQEMDFHCEPKQGQLDSWDFFEAFKLMDQHETTTTAVAGQLASGSRSNMKQFHPIPWIQEPYFLSSGSTTIHINWKPFSLRFSFWRSSNEPYFLSTSWWYCVM